jgi:O-antigen/teichoic acid export membrane protein
MTLNTNASAEKVAKGASVAFIGKVVSTAIKYLTDLAFAWLLGAEVFGLYTLGIVVYRFGELFTRMGLESGAIRFISIYFAANEKQKLKGILIQILGLPLLSGLILGLILFTLSDSIAQHIFSKPELALVLRIFAFALPWGASITVGAFATTGTQTTIYRTYIWEILLPLANLLLALILCGLGFGLQGAVFAWLGASVISFGVMLWVLVKVFPELLDPKIQATFDGLELLKFSIPLAFGSFAWLVLLWTDILMLGYFRPAFEVGIYRAASQTSLVMNIVASSLIASFSPLIANFYSRGERQEVEKIFLLSSRWSIALTLPFLLIILVVGDDLLRIFGQEFSIGWIPLLILCIAQLARAGAGGIAINMLSMTGHQYLKLYTDLGLSILNILLNLLLIPMWGMLGAAIATGISILVVNVLRVTIMRRILGLNVKVYNSSYLKILIAGIIAVLVGSSIHIFLDGIYFLVSLMLVSSLILFSYLGTLALLGLDHEEKFMIKKLAKRFQKVT